MESPCWNRILAEAVASERMQEQSFPGGLTPLNGPTLEQFMKDSLLREGFHTEAGKEHGVEAAMTRYELTTTSIPYPPVPLTGKRQKSYECS